MSESRSGDVGRALEAHRAGRLAEAQSRYREILDAHPGDAEAMHLLGVVTLQRGDPRAAAALIAEAIALGESGAAAHNNHGEALAACGEPDAAADAYRLALGIDSGHAQAHNNLANVLGARGRIVEAIEHWRRAIDTAPAFSIAHRNLGCALLERGEVAVAIDHLTRAVRLDPSVARAHHDLGRALEAAGRADAAMDAHGQALERDPGLLPAVHALGRLMIGAARPEAAQAIYRAALERSPRAPDLLVAMGDLASAGGDLQGAQGWYREALEADPANVAGHANLGSTLRLHGDLAGARASLERARALDPDSAAVENNLALVEHESGRHDEALAHLRRALRLRPDFAEAMANVGAVYGAQSRLQEAIHAYRAALERRSEFPKAWNSLGSVLLRCGDVKGAASAFGTAVKLAPRDPQFHSNLLLCAQYDATCSLPDLARLHAGWEREFGSPHAVAVGVRTPRRRELRVGFVSPDLGEHPVGRLLIGCFERLAEFGVEAFCYSDRLHEDALTREFKARSAAWRETRGMTDDRLADRIRADTPDALIDLSGHSAGNRLRVFADRPAPVQLTWLGYVGTTGLAAMDHLVSDAYLTPPGVDDHFTESVLRLPGAYVCYRPPRNAAPVGPLPMEDNGFVTFGSFNNPAKTNGEVIDLWSRILGAVGGSRLVLRYQGFDDTWVADRVRERFRDNGVADDRVELLGGCTHDELLASYGRIDVALDPFPYGGGITTCEALWMGVPVITCPAATFASRHAYSYLASLGLDEWIAGSRDDYVAIAAKLARDATALADIRAGLRPRMIGSVLCDATEFTRRLAAELRRVCAWPGSTARDIGARPR